MFRPTLYNFRASSGPKAIGLCQSDLSAVAAIVNEAQERLQYDPLTPDEGWVGGYASMVFNVIPSTGAAYVTAPYDVARIIEFSVCQRPIPLRNGFYEFLRYGSGNQPKTNCSTCSSPTQAYERDNAATMLDLDVTSPQIIRCFPSSAMDAGKRVLIQGNDANGIPVTSLDPVTRQSISGEYLYLASPFSQTVNHFTSITGIMKDTTVDRVAFWQVNPSSGATTVISIMEPLEGTTSYRRYLLNGLPANCSGSCSAPIQINAEVRREFIPVVSDSDYLFIPNVPALIEECQSIRYSRQDSKTSDTYALSHHAKAIALLNGQFDLYHGKTTTSISVPLFGSDRLRPQLR